VSPAVGFGAAAGLGLAMIASVILPGRPSLAQALHALTPPAVSADRPPAEPGGWAARAGQPLVPLLAAVGLPRPGLSADLHLCGRSRQRHAAEQATAILTGLAAPNLLATAAWAAGAPLGWALPAWASLVAAVAGGAGLGHGWDRRSPRAYAPKVTPHRPSSA
jgi:hypothetical protein